MSRMNAAMLRLVLLISRGQSSSAGTFRGLFLTPSREYAACEIRARRWGLMNDSGQGR